MVKRLLISKSTGTVQSFEKVIWHGKVGRHNGWAEFARNTKGKLSLSVLYYGDDLGVLGLCEMGSELWKQDEDTVYSECLKHRRRNENDVAWTNRIVGNILKRFPVDVHFQPGMSQESAESLLQAFKGALSGWFYSKYVGRERKE